jgi:hypothetical protein
VVKTVFESLNDSPQFKVHWMITLKNSIPCSTSFISSFAHFVENHNVCL